MQNHVHGRENYEKPYSVVVGFEPKFFVFFLSCSSRVSSSHNNRENRIIITNYESRARTDCGWGDFGTGKYNIIGARIYNNLPEKKKKMNHWY